MVYQIPKRKLTPVHIPTDVFQFSQIPRACARTGTRADSTRTSAREAIFVPHLHFRDQHLHPVRYADKGTGHQSVWPTRVAKYGVGIAVLVAYSVPIQDRLERTEYRYVTNTINIVAYH